METFRRPLRVLLAFVLALWASVAGADGLYDQPVLRIDPGHHSASLRRADVDAAGRFLVTGAHDKTVRVWDAVTGKLLRTIHMPQGPGNIGKVFAVAISPDGRLLAAGGWTGVSTDNIYIFDRENGAMVARLDGLPNVVLHLAFSPDGQRLAATLGGTSGLRLYQRQGNGWAELARNTEYGGRSSWAAFSADGQRLVTTSWDGKLRLYTSDGEPLRVADSGESTPSAWPFIPTAAALRSDLTTAPLCGSSMPPNCPLPMRRIRKGSALATCPRLYGLRMAKRCMRGAGTTCPVKILFCDGMRPGAAQDATCPAG